jgi:hypothetical protein
MRNVALIIKQFLVRRVNLYQGIVGIGFIIATVLVLATPVQMPDPDDWAYYYGVRNFSRGDLTINNQAQFV